MQVSLAVIFQLCDSTVVSHAGAGNGSNVTPIVSEEAQKGLHDTTELDYLTHIIIRMYENKRCVPGKSMQ